MAGAPILFLSTYRRGYRPPWADKPYATELSLRSLSPENSLSVVHSVVARERLPDHLAQVILERAEGNPFFLEELARAVGEYPELRSDIAVPDTIAGVLAARIDRLPEEAKRLLQTAAVLGREVSPRLLEAIWDGPGGLDPWLSELTRLEFLYEQTGPAKSVYVFKHALTQEVAYGSILHERRKILHAKVIDAIERFYRDRGVEHADTLAHHSLRAEVWDKAVDYLRHAGAQAQVKGAIAESLDRFEQALKLIPFLPANPDNLRRAIDVRLDLHLPLFVLGQIPRLVQLHEEAEQIARQLDDRRRLGHVAYRMGQYSWMNAQYSRGIQHCEEALRIATATNDPESRILAAYFLGAIYHALGRYRTAIDFLMRIIGGTDAELAKRRLGLATGSPHMAACGWLVACFAEVGEFEQALRYADYGVRAADALDQPYTQAFTYTFRAIPLISRGEFNEAVPWCERAVQLCETKGLLIWLSAAYSTLGWALAGSGRTAAGLPYLERSVTIWESIGTKINLPWFYSCWAEGLLLAGDVENAERTADRALELARASSERGNEAHTLRLLGDIAAVVDPPDVESGATLYEEARSLAEQLGMRPLLGRCHLGLGQLYRRQPNRQKAQEHLTIASKMFRDLDMRLWLKRTEASLKEFQ